MKRVIANFILLNVILWGIGLAVSSRCLHFLTVTMDTATPVTIRTSIGHGTIGLGGIGLESVTAVQPTDIEGDVVLRLKGCKDSSKLLRVALSSHFVFSRVWDDSDLIWEADDSVRLQSERAHWGVCPFFFWGLVVGELFLSLLASGIVWLSRSDVKGKWVDSLVVAGACSVLFVLVIPLQTHLGNPDCFQTSTSELLNETGAIAIVLLMILLALLEVGRRFGGQFYAATVVAFIFYEYLEVGVLSIGCPPLDGDAIVYKELVRGVCDAAVLLGLAFVMIWLRNSRVPFWTSLAVLVLAICSLFDAGSSTRLTFKSDLVDHPTENAAVIRSTVHSPKKNVLLHFLDCTATTHVLDVMSQSNEMREAFDGFYFCTNNIGMYHGTMESVPAVMTGSYHGVGADDFVSDMFSSPSIMAPYLARGAKVMIAPGFLNYGYTTETQLVNAADTECSQLRSPLHRRMVDQQQWSIYEVSKFRMTPFALKYYVYSMTIYGWKAFEGCAEESWTFPIVADAPIVDECELTLHSYHTIGAHPPYGTNRHGEYDPKITVGYLSKVEKTWYALAQSAELFRRLKERNLYDNHFMIFLADHGGEPMTPDDAVRPTDAPAKAYPFLMFKPIGSHGPLRYVDNPTSHSGVASVIKRLAERDVDASETVALLTRTNRIYRALKGSAWLEYRFGSDCYGSYERITLNHDAMLSAVELDHVYSFVRAKDSPPMESRDEGEEGMLYEGVHLNTPMRAHTLHTGVPNAGFHVEIEAWMRIQKNTGDAEKCRWILKDINSGAVVETCIRGDQREVRKLTLPVKTDAQGRIQFSMVNTGLYGLMTLRVTK